VQKQEGKKQFSLSLLMRIFLGLLVVISIGICARSIMQYNELNKEAEQLETALEELHEIRAELIENLGSADELKRILADYQIYKDLIDADTATLEDLREYQAQLDYIRELLNTSKNKDYIVKIAKDKLNLYFADEEIIYNDIN
jgi:cell division protein FtsB